MEARSTSARFDDEIGLVLMLSDPYLTPEAAEKMEVLCRSTLDWNRVLGMLILHRTAGQAWANLAENGLAKRAKFKPLSAVRVLNSIFKSQQLYVSEQIDRTVALMNRFAAEDIPCVLMKGAAVARMGYSRLGVRTFSDNDLLFERSDIARVGGILKEAGYVQGSWEAQVGAVKAASRNDVLLHPLTSHETYPYAKATPEAAVMEVHCVDVHFSVDLMTSNRDDEAVRDLIARRVTVPGNADGDLHTLSREDMFVFLCVHYQREASNGREADELRDYLLYKMMDLLAILGDRAQPLDLDETSERAKVLGFEREVFYALTHLEEIYPQRVPEGYTESFRPAGSLDYLHQITHNDQPVHTWSGSVAERFFVPQRTSELNRG